MITGMSEKVLSFDINTQTVTERIPWVDVFKFLGIWAIYIGHFGDKSGKVYPFVFTYHVPMFFFAAGFFAIRALKEPARLFIIKRTWQLLVSYAFFSLIALVFFAVEENWDILQTRNAALAFALGIRGKIMAGSLWFLPCLYLISVSDYVVMKLSGSRWAALLLAVGAFVISQTLLPHNPASEPSWFMNMDSALYYYIYFVLGSLLFQKLAGRVESSGQRISLVVLVLLAFALAILTYFQTPAWFYGKLASVFPALEGFALTMPLLNMVIALALIYCNVIIAKILAPISFLGMLGRETLVFCGTEDVFKHMFSLTLSMLSLKVRLVSPFMTIAFSLLCLVASNYSITWLLNTYFPWAVGKMIPTLKT
jgi:fucose 4-O-acetylase-like acetyltransferase